ncbi:MAG: YybH family protein [Actinomycetota bacterium]
MGALDGVTRTRLESVGEESAAVFQDALSAGNLEALVTLYEPDAVLVPEPGQIAAGLGAIRDSFARLLAAGGTFRITAKGVQEAAGLALESYEWTLDARGAGGDPITMGGPGTIVYRRQPDGRWLAVIDNPFPFV